MGYGTSLCVERHPVTGVCFENFSLPFWDEVEKLVLKAHAFIPSVISIGWDVAITEKGPVLLEGNDNWEISGPQDMDGGLKEKWYKLHDD